MQDFRRLAVWHKAHALTLQVYAATRTFPRDETYALTNQLRRAAVSIGANIAEGCGRGSDADFARYLYIATGSASELEYELLLAMNLGYLERSPYEALSNDCVEVKRMLAALLRKLTADS